MSSNGTVVQSESFLTTARFDADEEVLDVRTDGVVLAARYVVSTCERRMGNDVETPFRPGQVIVVHRSERREDASATVDGDVATPSALDVLYEVGALTPRHDSADALYGTSQPRSIREPWVPDLAAIAAALPRTTPLRIDRERLRGEGMIVERRILDSLLGSTIRVAISADGVRFENVGGSANEGFGRITLEVGGFFPDDVTRPELHSYTVMTADLHFDVRSGGRVYDARMTTTKRSDRTTRPIP